MNASIATADRATHLKIVLAAVLISAIFAMSLAIVVH